MHLLHNFLNAEFFRFRQKFTKIWMTLCLKIDYLLLPTKSSCIYLNAVIMDAQRLSSVVPISVFHRATADVSFEGYMIPQDTLVVACTEICHRDEAAWEKPNQLYPEHFLDKNGRLKAKHDNFLPFSLVVQRPQTTREESKDDLNSAGIEASKHTISRHYAVKVIAPAPLDRTPLMQKCHVKARLNIPCISQVADSASESHWPEWNFTSSRLLSCIISKLSLQRARYLTPQVIRLIFFRISPNLLRCY
ncbi:Cytochrome P450 [Trinorchestia longiramus]|nr:Cytochrome P450 [Trinorchestia longiramus]